MIDFDFKDPTEKLVCNYWSALAAVVGAGAQAGAGYYGNKQAADIAGRPPRLTPVPIPGYASAIQKQLSSIYGGNLSNTGPSFADFVNSGGTARLRTNYANPNPTQAIDEGIINPETGLPSLRYDAGSNRGFTPAEAYQLYRSHLNDPMYKPGGKKYSSRLSSIRESYDMANRSAQAYQDALARGRYGRAGKAIRRNEAANAQYSKRMSDWPNPANMGYGSSNQNNPYTQDDPRYFLYADAMRRGLPSSIGFGDAPYPDVGPRGGGGGPGRSVKQEAKGKR